MLAKAILAICLVWAIMQVAALDFNENIKVNGGGKLISKTNTEGGKDMVSAEGKQDYTRNISQDRSYSRLYSKYSLSGSTPEEYSYMRSFKIKSNTGGLDASNVKWIPYPYSEDISSNRYMIQMRSEKNMLHDVNIYGANNLELDNTIDFKDGKVKTNFVIEGSGKLRESVVNFNLPKKPDFIADTEIIDSDFSLSSGLADDATVGFENEALVSWARASTPVPASIEGDKPKIDLERGIIGSPEKKQAQRTSKDNQTQIIPGTEIGGTTLEPILDMDESEQDKSTDRLNDGTGVTSDKLGILTTKSVPNGVTNINLTDAIADKKFGTENPWQSWEFNQPSAAILIMPLKNDPIPMAYIGKVAQFDYFSGFASPKSVDIDIPGYTVSDEHGVRTVESEKCKDPESPICQDYTHISAPQRDAPVIWASQFAQLDRLITPFIP